MLQLLHLPLVFSNPDVAPAAPHTCHHGCDCSISWKLSVPISHPDPTPPTPGDHHCIGKDCPKCPKKPDLPPQPPSESSLAAYLSAVYFDEKYCNSALQIQSVYLLESVILDVAPISQPDPPHVCKDIPCAFCGRKWF